MRRSDFDLFFAPSLSMAASSEVHSVVKVQPGKPMEELFKVSRQSARRVRGGPAFLFFSSGRQPFTRWLC